MGCIQGTENEGEGKVLLRNQAIIAQVIAEPGAWLLNRLLELEKRRERKRERELTQFFLFD